MKLKDLKSVRMYVFEGSKTKEYRSAKSRKHLEQRNLPKVKMRLNSDQLEKVRDLKENLG